MWYLTLFDFFRLRLTLFNPLRPRQDGRQFPDDIFKCIFVNDNVSIAIKISLRFVPKSPINNIAALVQIMAWRRPGDKPLSEPMLVSLPSHICVTRSQWVIVTLQCDILALVWLFGPANVTFWTCQCDFSALRLFPARGTLPHELKKIQK